MLGGVIHLAEPSMQSVYIVAMGTSATKGPVDLGTGTGFVVQRDGRRFLITNYHVASGRNPLDGQARHPLGLEADSLKLVLPKTVKPGRIEWSVIDLPVLVVEHDREEANWLVHPVLGRKVDVVALPLDAVPGIDALDVRAYDLDEPGGIVARPSLPVNVVGYPYGKPAGGAFPFWTTGTVATEPELGFDDLPRFLVHARTTPGQSGSPVIFFAPQVKAGPDRRDMVELIGVYSGRVAVDGLELAVVWRRDAIEEVLAGGRLGGAGVQG